MGLTFLLVILPWALALAHILTCDLDMGLGISI